MKIHCKNCGLFLGEIRDANLRKKISHICFDCTEIHFQEIEKEYKQNKIKDSIKDPTVEHLRSIFGMED